LSYVWQEKNRGAADKFDAKLENELKSNNAIQEGL
jgi:hypothetical protein